MTNSGYAYADQTGRLIPYNSPRPVIPDLDVPRTAVPNSHVLRWTPPSDTLRCASSSTVSQDFINGF